MYLLGGPRQRFSFQGGPETPKGQTPLEGSCVEKGLPWGFPLTSGQQPQRSVWGAPHAGPAPVTESPRWAAGQQASVGARAWASPPPSLTFPQPPPAFRLQLSGPRPLSSFLCRQAQEDAANKAPILDGTSISGLAGL